MLLESTLIQICNLRIFSTSPTSRQQLTNTRCLRSKKAIQSPVTKPADRKPEIENNEERKTIPQHHARMWHNREQISEQRRIQRSHRRKKPPAIQSHRARGELAGSAATNSQQSTSSGQNEENAANLQNSHGSTQAQAELSGQQVDPREHAGANNKWTQTEAQQVWQAALGDLESMTESFARMVTKVVAVGTQHLRLEFPANGTLAMKRCELPEHRNTLVKAVSKHADAKSLSSTWLPPRLNPRKRKQPLTSHPESNACGKLKPTI